MTLYPTHLPRRAHTAPSPLLAPVAIEEPPRRDTARLRVGLLRRRFGLEGATARLIASLAYGDPRQ